MEINSPVWKCKKENQECTSGDYSSRKVLSVRNIFRIELEKILSLFFSVSIWVTTVSTSITFCGNGCCGLFLDVQKCTQSSILFHCESTDDCFENGVFTMKKEDLRKPFCWEWSRDLNSGPTNTKTFFVTYIEKSDIQVIW